MFGCFGRASAYSFGHAGEILQGVLPGYEDSSPFLVTLPASVYWSKAVVVLRANPVPVRDQKVFHAARLASAHWLTGAHVQVCVQSNIPHGRGAGSSTADCVAAVRATARLAGITPTPEEIAQLVFRAERATDPLMYPPAPVAFLPRRGKLLQTFAADWPPMHVAVVDLGGAPKPTLQQPLPPYTDVERQEFRHLLGELNVALLMQDAASIGRIATRSAEMLGTHQPDPAWQQLASHARRQGAYGVARAHTGNLAAVLSPEPWTDPCLAKYQLPFAHEEPEIL